MRPYRHRLSPVRHENRLPVMDLRNLIDDDTWFELQFSPEDALRRYGIVLPAFPPDDVQLGFTGRSGRSNLQQAFSFYRYVCAVCRLKDLREPRILDFGGGWGRISRFFLRDTKPEFIFVADCMSEAVHWLHATGNPCNIIKNEPRPPIGGLGEPLELTYAFSVFSHLSEDYLHAWITYLMDWLRPNGYLVFTTRGHQFIDYVEQLQRKTSPLHGILQEHQTRLQQRLPAAQELRRRHMSGEFQFYPLGGAGELTPDFFGETFIPRSYLERSYGSALIDFTEDVPDVDQSVVVLQKN